MDVQPNMVEAVSALAGDARQGGDFTVREAIDDLVSKDDGLEIRKPLEQVLEVTIVFFVRAVNVHQVAIVDKRITLLSKTDRAMARGRAEIGLQFLGILELWWLLQEMGEDVVKDVIRIFLVLYDGDDDEVE